MPCERHIFLFRSNFLFSLSIDDRCPVDPLGQPNHRLLFVLSNRAIERAHQINRARPRGSHFGGTSSLCLAHVLSLSRARAHVVGPTSFALIEYLSSLPRSRSSFITPS